MLQHWLTSMASTLGTRLPAGRTLKITWAPESTIHSIAV